MVLPDNPLVQHPAIAPQIAPIVKVSGFDISEVRVTYTPNDDTLSLGLNQPPSQNQPGAVIAGDADNNGNSGTVNPAVTSTPGFAGFQDPANFGGTESMGAFLDFTGSGNPQIVAGFSTVPPTPTATDPSPQKPYQVAVAIPTGPNAAPAFGTSLPQFAGNFYTNNASDHPNFEFAIRDFSQLYQAVTGQTLTPDTVINIGAFGGSGQDIGIGEAFFPAQPLTLGAATPPEPEPPPISPPILINPHEHRIVDTGHRDLVRVYVIGSSGFDVTTIDPATVSLNGATPVTSFTRQLPRNEFPIATYVFVGSDIDLPAGQTMATFTARTFSGQAIESSKLVVNVPNSARATGEARRLMGNGGNYSRLSAVMREAPTATAMSRGGAVSANAAPASDRVQVRLASRQAAKDFRVNYKEQLGTTGTTAAVVTPRQVVALKSAPTPTVNLGAASSLPRNLNASLDSYLSQGDFYGPRNSLGTTSLSAV